METKPHHDHGATLPWTSHVDHNFKPVSPQQTKHAALPASSTDVAAVIKTGDRKKIKIILRENNWPAQHEARKGLWRNICKMMLKDARTASIYQEMVKDVFGEGEDMYLKHLIHLVM